MPILITFTILCDVCSASLMFSIHNNVEINVKSILESHKWEVHRVGAKYQIICNNCK